MQFRGDQYLLTWAITKDPRLSLVGGMMGGNLAAVVLIAAASRPGQLAGTPALPAATTTTTTTTSPPRWVEVPELVRDARPLDADEAKLVLASRGLVGVIEMVASGEPVDSVIRSDPPAESVVRVGSTVSILVSVGLEVPNVTGKPVADAEKALQEAGFEVVETRASDMSGKQGTVERQDPAAGSFADASLPVTIYVFEAARGLRKVEGAEDE